MNITQKDIDDLVYNFKWSNESFKNKRVTDIYRQGILDVVELLKKKEQPFNKERLMEVAKQETPEEKAEAEERKETRKWLNFENTHEDISVGKPPLEEDLVGMGGLGKAWEERAERLKKSIEDNRLGCIVQRLDKVIELLQSAILPIPRETYVPPIIYKNPLDPDPNTLGGWETTVSTDANCQSCYFNSDNTCVRHEQTDGCECYYSMEDARMEHQKKMP